MLYEDTEYLPTCGAIPIGRKGRNSMDGKILTKNIRVFAECKNKKCEYTDQLSIEDIRIDKRCPDCKGSMILGEEGIIRN